MSALWSIASLVAGLAIGTVLTEHLMAKWCRDDTARLRAYATELEEELEFTRQLVISDSQWAAILAATHGTQRYEPFQQAPLD